MNELLFFFQIGAIIASILAFSKLEKAGLYCIFILQIVLANLFLLKQISLFNLSVTTTDCFTIGSIFCLNLITENYGKKASNQAILAGLFSVLFTAMMSIFLLSYHPIEACTMHKVYSQILTPSSFIFLVSVCCMLVSQKLDTFLFSRFRKSYSFKTSMIGSTSISQAFDTICFSIFALSWFVENIFSIIFFSYLIKMITIVFMSLFSTIIARRPRDVTI